MLITIYQLILLILHLSIYEVSNFHEDEHLGGLEIRKIGSRPELTVLIGMERFGLDFIHVLR